MESALILTKEGGLHEMMNWLRTSNMAAGILVVLRVYVGWLFLKAGWTKITAERAFDATGFLKGVAAKATGQVPSVQQWYADFVSDVALPNVDVFNFLVPWGELLVGIGLITGTLTTFSVVMGLLMNFNYLLAGAVSTNPNMVFCEFWIAAAGWNAGKFGLDYWVIPWLRAKVGARREVRTAGSGMDV
jgi:thiosulfate dehydrogenase [quinone] large subunit